MSGRSAGRVLLADAGEGAPLSSVTAVCLSMWQKPVMSSNDDVLPALWDDVDKYVREACAHFRIRDNKLKVQVPGKAVASSGAVLNDMVVHLADGVKIGLELLFEIQTTDDGSTWRLSTAVYKFSRPVLAAGNFKINGWAAFWKKVIGQLDEEAILQLAERAKVTKFDISDAGQFTKSAFLAFDRVEIKTTPQGPSIELELTGKDFLQRGWGVFTFALAPEDCVDEKEKGLRSHYLGDGYAGEESEGECWAKQVGPRFGRPIVKWMFKESAWQAVYNRFDSSRKWDPTVSFTALVNFILGTGIKDSADSWDALAAKQDMLGEGYKRWKSIIWGQD